MVIPQLQGVPSALQPNKYFKARSLTGKTDELGIDFCRELECCSHKSNTDERTTALADQCSMVYRRHGNACKRDGGLSF